MGLDKIEVEKHLVEHEIIKPNMELNFVPYVNATTNVNLGSNNFTTTGSATVGRVVLGDSENICFGAGGLTGSLGADGAIFSDGTDLILQVESPVGFSKNPKMRFTYFNFDGAPVNSHVNVISFEEELYGRGIVENGLWAFDPDGINEGEFAVPDKGYPGTAKYVRLTFDSTNEKGVIDTVGTTVNLSLQPTGSIEIPADNKKLYFGTGNDASITFDGNSLNIKGNEVTSGDVIEIQTATLFNKDIWFVGDANGLPYGSCTSAGTDIAWSQASAVQNTWYDISDTGMSDGLLNLVTHDGSGKLTVNKAGKYLVNYTITFSSDTATCNIETAIRATGVESSNGIGHLEAVTANTEYQLKGTAIINLAASGTIDLAIRTTDATTPTISIEFMDITILMTGG